MKPFDEEIGDEAESNDECQKNLPFHSASLYAQAAFPGETPVFPATRFEKHPAKQA